MRDQGSIQLALQLTFLVDLCSLLARTFAIAYFLLQGAVSDIQLSHLFVENLLLLLQFIDGPWHHRIRMELVGQTSVFIG